MAKQKDARFVFPTPEEMKALAYSKLQAPARQDATTVAQKPIANRAPASRVRTAQQQSDKEGFDKYLRDYRNKVEAVTAPSVIRNLPSTEAAFSKMDDWMASEYDRINNRIRFNSPDQHTAYGHEIGHWAQQFTDAFPHRDTLHMMFKGLFPNMTRSSAEELEAEIMGKILDEFTQHPPTRGYIDSTLQDLKIKPSIITQEPGLWKKISALTDNYDTLSEDEDKERKQYIDWSKLSGQARSRAERILIGALQRGEFPRQSVLPFVDMAWKKDNPYGYEAAPIIKSFGSENYYTSPENYIWDIFPPPAVPREPLPWYNTNPVRKIRDSDRKVTRSSPFLTPNTNEQP